MRSFTSYAARRSLDVSHKAKAPLSLLAAPVQTADELTPEEYLEKLQNERGLCEDDVAILHRVYSDGYQATTVALERPIPALPFNPVPFSPEAQADKFAALPIGGAQDAKLRERVILRHPACTGWFTHVYQSRNALLGIQAANESITQLDASLSVRGDLGELRFSADDDGVDTFSIRFAEHVGRLVALHGPDVAIRMVLDLAYEYCLNPVATVTKQQAADPLPTLNRWADMAWVRRRVRTVSARRLYDASRKYALVSARLAAYTTDLSLARRTFRRARNAETLDALVAHDAKDVFTAVSMTDAIAGSVSNPSNRRAELMTRLAGFRNVAKEQRHVAIFLTFTCPSRFHSVHRNGQQNQKWVDAGCPSVRDAQAWLIKSWNNIRKRADEAEIKPYGVRFAEPHHDGTPHWHAVLFMTSQQVKQYVKICRTQMLADSGTEPGAKQHRFKIVFIDPRKGDAVAYCSKYIAKNIDGFAVGKDHEAGKNAQAVHTAARIDAWKSDNRIRQFQQIGGPSVTAWREFRTIRDELDMEDPMFHSLTKEQHFALENVRKAADAGDWAAFCCAMGGVQVRRNDQTVRVHYGIPETMKLLCDEDGVALHTPRTKTQYGDQAASRAMGLMYANIFLLTRAKEWLITSKEKWEAACRKTMEGVRDQFETLHEEREYSYMEYEEYEALRHLAICDYQSRAWFLFSDDERLAGPPQGCEPHGGGLDPCH